MIEQPRYVESHGDQESQRSVRTELTAIATDLKSLALDYIKLARSRYHDTAQIGKQVFALLVVGAGLAIVGFAELIFGLVGLLVAHYQGIHDGALIATIAGLLTIGVSGAAVMAGMGLLKKLMSVNPLELVQSKALARQAGV